MAGNNQTHTATPGAAATLGNNQSLLATCASIQRTTPSLLPVIGINPLNFGAAPGAPGIVTVDSADGLVQLFNSAASRAILSVPEDAALYDAYYKALLGLNKAASRPTQLRGLRVGKQAAGFLGQNLAAQLQDGGDLTLRHRRRHREQDRRSRSACIAAKAFAEPDPVGHHPAMRDDPHGAFGDMQNRNMTVSQLRQFRRLHGRPRIDARPVVQRASLDSVMTVHGAGILRSQRLADGTPRLELDLRHG
jgi:hypothetical protein